MDRRETALRRAAAHVAREQTHLTDVLLAGHPAQESTDKTHTHARTDGPLRSASANKRPSRKRRKEGRSKRTARHRDRSHRGAPSQTCAVRGTSSSSWDQCPRAHSPPSGDPTPSCYGYGSTHHCRSSVTSGTKGERGHGQKKRAHNVQSPTDAWSHPRTRPHRASADPRTRSAHRPPYIATPPSINQHQTHPHTDKTKGTRSLGGLMCACA